MSSALSLVLLFSLATFVAIATRVLRVPYTIGLVVAGLVVGTATDFEPPHLTKDLLFAVFLPGLLYEAAFHLEFRKFWENRVTIHVLAIPGLIAAVVLTALLLTPAANALHFIDDFTLTDGFLFAAIIAATDPVAVVSMFKSFGAPRRLTTLIEGESLFNDGTSVVLFVVVLGAISAGEVSLWKSVVDFLLVVGMGVLVGAAIGFLLAQVTRFLEDPMLEITLTTIAAYGSFVLAEHFHFSGVIATVVAGMLGGNYAARIGMSPATRVAVESFWSYIAFALNSIIFLLIGFEVSVSSLLSHWSAILVAFAAVSLGRGLMVFAATAFLRRTREKIPWSWATVLTWGGLRGGLSMVLALGLPQDFPHREFLVTVTFGVVVLSILLQGLTMTALLRRLGLLKEKAQRLTYERARGALLIAQAARAAIDALAGKGYAAKAVIDELREVASARVEKANADLHALGGETQWVRHEQRFEIERHLLQVEKDAALAARREATLGDEAADALIADIDARLHAIEERDA
ncbi:MAG: sodium:proton antiporter [Deltaproteobacteria bacterium]|nr:sodium:proton antiporter [Deltaproteobacteria bacterium]